MIQPITSLQSITFAQINLLVHLAIENVGLKEDDLICHWAHVGREILGRQGVCNSLIALLNQTLYMRSVNHLFICNSHFFLQFSWIIKSKGIVHKWALRHWLSKASESFNSKKLIIVTQYVASLHRMSSILSKWVQWHWKLVSKRNYQPFQLTLESFMATTFQKPRFWFFHDQPRKIKL